MIHHWRWCIGYGWIHAKGGVWVSDFAEASAVSFVKCLLEDSLETLNICPRGGLFSAQSGESRPARPPTEEEDIHVWWSLLRAQKLPVPDSTMTSSGLVESKAVGSHAFAICNSTGHRQIIYSVWMIYNTVIGRSHAAVESEACLEGCSLGILIVLHIQNLFWPDCFGSTRLNFP